MDAPLVRGAVLSGFEAAASVWCMSALATDVLGSAIAGEPLAFTWEVLSDLVADVPLVAVEAMVAADSF